MNVAASPQRYQQGIEGLNGGVLLLGLHGSPIHNNFVNLALLVNLHRQTHVKLQYTKVLLTCRDALGVFHPRSRAVVIPDGGDTAPEQAFQQLVLGFLPNRSPNIRISRNQTRYSRIILLVDAVLECFANGNRQRRGGNRMVLLDVESHDASPCSTIDCSLLILMAAWWIHHPKRQTKFCDFVHVTEGRIQQQDAINVLRNSMYYTVGTIVNAVKSDAAETCKNKCEPLPLVAECMRGRG